MRPECWRCLLENGDMPSDTHTDASDATTPGPEIRNGHLVVLMAREQQPDVEAELKVRVGSLKIRPSSFNQRVTVDCQTERLDWG